MTPWDPDCYLTYQKERFAPFEDLLPMVRLRPNLRVIDLGCGTGELTLRLADRLPDSHVVGIDTSEEMLEKARGVERPCRRATRFRAGDSCTTIVLPNTARPA